MILGRREHLQTLPVVLHAERANRLEIPVHDGRGASPSFVYVSFESYKHQAGEDALPEANHTGCPQAEVSAAQAPVNIDEKVVLARPNLRPEPAERLPVLPAWKLEDVCEGGVVPDEPGILTLDRKVNLRVRIPGAECPEKRRGEDDVAGGTKPDDQCFR